MKNIPLLAGCAALQQRETDVVKSREAIALMIDAVKAAAKDCGNESILQYAQVIYAPRGTWLYSDPARLIAGAINAPQCLFFRQWTLKEAYIKALGETINSVRLHEIAFESAPEAVLLPLFAVPTGRWQFLHWRFDGDHHLALACQRPECDTGRTETAPCRFWLWDTETQSRHELTDEWPCTL